MWSPACNYFTLTFWSSTTWGFIKLSVHFVFHTRENLGLSVSIAPRNNKTSQLKIWEHNTENLLNNSQNPTPHFRCDVVPLLSALTWGLCHDPFPCGQESCTLGFVTKLVEIIFAGQWALVMHRVKNVRTWQFKLLFPVGWNLTKQEGKLSFFSPRFKIGGFAWWSQRLPSTYSVHVLCVGVSPSFWVAFSFVGLSAAGLTVLFKFGGRKGDGFWVVELIVLHCSFSPWILKNTQRILHTIAHIVVRGG